MKKFEVNEVCKSCGGTGLFAGMAESSGAAVVCHHCKGTGCFKHVHQYEEFKKRKKSKNILRVYLTNPGIMIGEGLTEEGDSLKLEDFGGMPFEDWNSGKKFPKRSEMRKYTCPAWWYQSADYSKKPSWKECSIVGSFSTCPSFQNKDKCWDKWDKEYNI